MACGSSVAAHEHPRHQCCRSQRACPHCHLRRRPWRLVVHETAARCEEWWCKVIAVQLFKEGAQHCTGTRERNSAWAAACCRALAALA